MKITSDRSELDLALQDPTNIFFLLFGAEQSIAGAIHDVAVKLTMVGWRQIVLITDISLLLPEEKVMWYSGPDTYTLVSKVRAIVKQAPLRDLTFGSGKANARLITAALSSADMA